MQVLGETDGEQAEGVNLPDAAKEGAPMIQGQLPKGTLFTAANKQRRKMRLLS